MGKKKTETIIYNDHDGYDWDDAEKYCIERHLEEYPEETDWEPTDEEIQEEIRISNETSWDSESSLLKNFFDDGSTYIITGFIGNWDGRHYGGRVFKGFNGLNVCFCYKTKIFDDKGVFNIHSYHHDGVNCFEVKKLTKRGEAYYNNHKYDDPQTLHEKLLSKGYSVNLHYAKKVYGR